MHAGEMRRRKIARSSLSILLIILFVEWPPILLSGNFSVAYKLMIRDDWDKLVVDYDILVIREA